MSSVLNKDCRQRGFTLLELLVGLTLLTLLAGVLYTSFGLSDRANDAGLAATEASTNMRLVASFTRRYLGKARVVAVKEGAKRYAFFRGSTDEVIFLSELPAYLGIGGLHVIHLTVKKDTPGTRQLLMRFRVFDPSARDVPWEESVLIEDLTSIRFNYFGDPNRVGARRWHDEWRRSRRLPELVRIETETAAAGHWPDVVVDIKVDQRLGTGPNSRNPLLRSIDSLL